MVQTLETCVMKRHNKAMLTGMSPWLDQQGQHQTGPGYVMRTEWGLGIILAAEETNRHYQLIRKQLSHMVTEAFLDFL